MIKAVLFDLDGTLLPMDQDVFVATYFKRLAMAVGHLGYEPKPLQDAVWKGTGAMVMNDGSRLNSDAFWDCFNKIFGRDTRVDEPAFDEFYRTEFNKVKEVCGFQPMSREVVEYLLDAGFRTALATNPIFPAIATRNRMNWAGLDPEMFELFTSYENIGYCKPNPKYYQEVIDRMGLKPEECLMVGNDVGEDMVPASSLGMSVFLVTDCMINKAGEDIEKYPHGGFPELLAYLKQLNA